MYSNNYDELKYIVNKKGFREHIYNDRKKQETMFTNSLDYMIYTIYDLILTTSVKDSIVDLIYDKYDSEVVYGFMNRIKDDMRENPL